jgi:hypothetical protein
MSHTLIYSAKPSTGVLVYEHTPVVDLAVNKFINAIFRQKKAQARLQFKDGKYFYSPSSEYILRVKSIVK